VKGRRKGDPWAVARANALARGATLPPARPALPAPPPAAPAPARRPQGTPSATEERYRLEVLEPARLAGEVVGWVHQPAPPYLLAHRCVFTPDYRVAYADGTTEVVDVKRAEGWNHEDATLKLKFLARLRPDLRCVQAHRLRGGGWRRRVIPGGEPT